MEILIELYAWLQALGVSVELGPESISKCLDAHNIGFMFAPRYLSHPSARPWRRMPAPGLLHSRDKMHLVFSFLCLLGVVHASLPCISSIGREASCMPALTSW